MADETIYSTLSIAAASLGPVLVVLVQSCFAREQAKMNANREDAKEARAQEENKVARTQEVYEHAVRLGRKAESFAFTLRSTKLHEQERLWADLVHEMDIVQARLDILGPESVASSFGAVISQARAVATHAGCHDRPVTYTQDLEKISTTLQQFIETVRRNPAR